MLRFILAFALAIVAIIGTARVLTSGPCPQQPTLLQQALRVVALWKLTRPLRHETPPAQVEEQVPLSPEQMGAFLGNDLEWQRDAAEQRMSARPPMRTTSASGTPELDHAAGW